jgi:hypothetical protein
MTTVVPAYRCGAVPDSHRVPCCHPRALAQGTDAVPVTIVAGLVAVKEIDREERTHATCLH